MMKIKETKNRGYYVHYPHLGLGYLAGVLQKEDFAVSIIDSVAENLSVKDLIYKILKVNPDIVGITVTTPTLRVVKELINKMKVKQLNPIIVVGGPHVSAHPEIIIHLDVQFGFQGEAEYGFLNFCQNITSSNFNPGEIPGLVYFDNGSLKINPLAKISDLDKLPFPARYLFKNDKYSNPVTSARTTSLITVRGCPFDCLFCSRAVHPHSYEKRSINNVLEEIWEIKDKFNIEYITIMDETFTYERKRVLEFCEDLIKLNIGILWACQTRADLVDEELLKKMKSGGCQNLSFGVESGSAQIRGILRKPVDENHYRRLVAWCKNIGIETNAYYMFGHLGETKEELLNTIKFAKSLGTDYASFNITNIFPASPIYKQLEIEKKISVKTWIDYLDGNIDLPSLTPPGLDKEFLQNIMRSAYLSYYFRIGYLVKRLLQIIKRRKLSDVIHNFRIFLILAKDYIFS